MPSTIEARLKDLGYTLPAAPPPAGNYVPCMISGQLLFVSGQLPKDADGHLMTGRLGADLTVEDGQKAAALCTINILTQAKEALGDLTRIAGVMRLNGFVNATPDFTAHPKIIDGASDLMASALGDIGRHTRIAVGVASLPFAAAVEVDAVFAITPA
ncbi:MAG: RidA family protein [Pseudomonadota bacterium]